MRRGVARVAVLRSQLRGAGEDYSCVLDSIARIVPKPRSAVARVPNATQIDALVQSVRAAAFPEYFGRLAPAALSGIADDVTKLTTECAALDSTSGQPRAARQPSDTAAAFVHALPDVVSKLRSDVDATLARDPATTSHAEVSLAYPGVAALCYHRVAHLLHSHGAHLISRLVAERGHAATGIDIHPGAVIGHRCYIDHGTGLVIGGTAVVGDNVTLFHGATLGAKAFPKAPDGTLLKHVPRHPILRDDVTVFAFATILGRVTIGRGATIGANALVMRDVADKETVRAASATP